MKPDEQITEKWLEDIADINEKVTANGAVSFINHFFSVLDQTIFDPDIKIEERKLVRDLLIESVSENSMSRKDILNNLNKELKKLKLSHLIALGPKHTEMIIKMTGGSSSEKAKEAVSSKIIGNIGYIKVTSFLVPSVTLKQVKEAFRNTANAKYMIYDLRSNGGGSGSSVSYLIEGLLGPNKTIKFAKTRNGLSYTKPFVQYGYFNDDKNLGSEAEIEFEKEKGFVEWRTRKDAKLDKRKSVVLVNDKCASSCDIFAAAIKEHNASTLIGSKTAGHVLGGTAFKLLWRGYIAITPTAQVISPKGNLYEGIGVEPDIFLSSCNDNTDECIEEVIRKINGGSI
jgi:C-terminal processing protease CtpA/Prc